MGARPMKSYLKVNYASKNIIFLKLSQVLFLIRNMSLKNMYLLFPFGLHHQSCILAVKLSSIDIVMGLTKSITT
jgi:hypothetical protein